MDSILAKVNISTPNRAVGNCHSVVKLQDRFYLHVYLHKPSDVLSHYLPCPSYCQL